MPYGPNDPLPLGRRRFQYSQADEVSVPRGGGIPPGSGHLKPNSSALLSLCCFLGAGVLAKPLQQVSSLDQLVKNKRAAPQRRGQPALRVSAAAQTGLNAVYHIETPPVPLLGGGGGKKGETPGVGVKTPSWQDVAVIIVFPAL